MTPHNIGICDDAAYRAIATAVILQAAKDLGGGGTQDYGGGALRTATQFFQPGDGGLRFWCALAGLNAEYVSRVVQRQGQGLRRKAQHRPRVGDAV